MQILVCVYGGGVLILLAYIVYTKKLPKSIKVIWSEEILIEEHICLHFKRKADGG